MKIENKKKSRIRERSNYEIKFLSSKLQNLETYILIAS